MKLKKWQSIITGLALAAVLATASGLTTLPAQAQELDGRLMAVAQNMVTITFHASSGRGTVPDPITGASGRSVIVPGAQLTYSAADSGWLFTGWSTNASASVPEYCPGDTLILEGSTTLYAVYSRAAYTVEFRMGNDVTSEQVLPGGYPQHIPAWSESGDAVWLDSSGEQVDPSRKKIWRDQVYTAASDLSAGLTVPVTVNSSASHSKYMNGGDDGLFHPADSLTRAELAQMLYAVVEQRPETTPTFSDVASDAWYAPAVETIAGLGIMDGGSDGAFRPDQAVTRAECAVAFSRVIPSDSRQRTAFPDVPVGYWAYDAIARVGGYGLFQGDEKGYFNPDSGLSRAETVVVFNRLLGRAPDAATLASADNLRVFPDVPTTHWAYSHIMEATVSHESVINGSGVETWTSVTTEKTALPDGYYRIDGWLYCVKNGVFLHGTAGQTYTDGVFTFDENGRYTTGNAELDQRLNAIVETYTNDSMTRDQKLRALYNYVRDNYTYLSRPHVSKGQTGWEPAYALFFLQNGKGNCFSFSATYCLLCRELGQPAYTVVGGLGRSASPHGWVEIVLDGTRYMFDTQLEWRYLHDYGRSGYNLFKMVPGKTPFIYTW